MVEREYKEGKRDVGLEDWLTGRRIEYENRDRYISLLSGDTLCKILDEGLVEEERQAAKYGDKL